MIRGRCRTNLDEGRRYQWPEFFAAVPRKDEYVESVDGPSPGYKLRVCTVTYVMTRVYHQRGKSMDCRGQYDLEPAVEIELNRAF